MAYAQGTQIRVKVEIRDPDTGAPLDPDDVVVTVWLPDNTTQTLTYGGGDVVKQNPGAYVFTIDTTSQAGLWRYEVAATGAEAVIKQRKVRVTPRYSALPT